MSSGALAPTPSFLRAERYAKRRGGGGRIGGREEERRSAARSVLRMPCTGCLSAGLPSSRCGASPRSCGRREVSSMGARLPRRRLHTCASWTDFQRRAVFMNPALTPVIRRQRHRPDHLGNHVAAGHSRRGTGTAPLRLRRPRPDRDEQRRQHAGPARARAALPGAGAGVRERPPWAVDSVADHDRALRGLVRHNRGIRERPKSPEHRGLPKHDGGPQRRYVLAAHGVSRW